MSQENVEVVRLLYPGTVDLVAALDDPDLAQSAASLVHADFQTVGGVGVIPMSHDSVEVEEESGQPTTYGPDGFIGLWRDWLTAWESWVVTPTEFIDVDEHRVLVLLNIRARSKTHQVEMPMEGANLLTLKDRKLTRLELFFDRGEALKAAGLSE